jgi:DegV family protein with EDD domain
MRKMVVFTDSTANIPSMLIAQHDIHVVPLSLVWGKDIYRDGIDITSADLYARLKTAKEMPSTSQVSPEEFERAFAPLVEAGDSILGIFISGALSGTVESARKAKSSFPKANIEILDSRCTVMALGFAVLAAARAASSGEEFQEVAAIAQRAISCCGVVFVVDTLDYLYRGGRIGGAQHLIGTALNMKPLLEVRDGRVEAVERIRTKAKAKERLLEILRERIGDRTPLRLSPLHVDAESEGQELLAAVQSQFQPVECFLSEASPIIGIHAGPGTIGVAYCAGQ